MHQPGAQSLANLKAQLLTLNAQNEYPFILREEGDDIVASWNIVDAKWLEILGKGGLKKQYELRLIFDESKKQVSSREKSTDVEWDAALGGFTYKKSVQVGKRLEFSAGRSWGIKEEGRPGQIYSYKFVSTEITDPVFDIVRNAGWQVRGVLANKKRRKFIIAGAVAAALAIFIGIGALLFTSLGGMKEAARAEIDLLREAQYAQAYQASAWSLQRKMSSEEFQQAVESAQFADIIDYSFNKLSVENNVGRLSGRVVFKNGAPGIITVTMLKEGDQWKLAAVSVD